MKQVLLIYPKYSDTFWSFRYALKFMRRKAALPPLGLVTIAAMLPKQWKLKLVDLNVQKLTSKDLKWADYAFISAMIVQKQSTHHVIERCQQAKLKIVAGGPLFASEHHNFPQVDHFILNEAEITLPPFLEDLKNNQAKPIYTSNSFANITETPVPVWNLLNMNKYASMSIQFSRGCPYNCDFCNVTALFGRRPRVKTKEQILAELDALISRGWQGQVFFVDDNFIGNRRYLKKELLPALIAWQKQRNFITPFYTEVSIDLVDDPNLMTMMREAGFDTVFIGIETPSEEALAECSKKQNRNRNLIDDIKTIQRFGFQVQGGFIVGFDSDTPSIFQRQVDFIQKSGIVTAMVGLLQAFPGTRLYDRMKEQGRLRNDFSGDNADGTTNILPSMDSDLLHKGYKYIMDQIYSPQNCYKRIRTFLREYQIPKIATRYTLKDIFAFHRANIHLGIFGKERFQYWKLLLWTLFRRRRLFYLSVSLAIYAHHFRKVNEQHIKLDKYNGPRNSDSELNL